jgi:predicted RNA-binding Zn-ribbon protein involved in translation (DUF1610 family)
MMMKKLEKKTSAFTIDLAQIEGDGSFPCPKCGTAISPDDNSGETYEIQDTKVVNDKLDELVITCCKCKSTLKLTGFQADVDA